MWPCEKSEGEVMRRQSLKTGNFHGRIRGCTRFLGTEAGASRDRKENLYGSYGSETDFKGASMGSNC